VLFYLSGWICVTLLHLAAAVLLRRGYRQGLLAARKVQLVGTIDKIRQFQALNAEREHGVEVVGIFILPSDPREERSHFNQTLERAVAHARRIRVDDVVCLLPWSDERMIERCTNAFLSLPAAIHLGADEVLKGFRDLRVAKLGAMLCIELARVPLSLAKRLIKRLLDVIIAASALLLLWPLLLAAAIAIKLDSPGPVLFFQRRYGFNNEVFRIVKFRTMTATDDGAHVPQATRNDARVTRVGRFLRRWNIDELPQLLNVIAGSMSIVGPRPHAMSHNYEFERRIALYARRHNVKPGITGWAQVNGLRGITDTEDKIRNRVAFDLYYIDNWSLGLDIYIMALTLLSPRSYRNAF
jgi:Undecaprenyl-phosphate glucose phosphotransferase